MAETIVTIPAADLDRLVYVAIAEARNDAEIELLAGLADRILQRRPNVAPANLAAAIEQFRAVIATTRPARAAELAPNTSLLMSRMLTRSVPGLTSTVSREGARDYTRAFFRSHRDGVPLRRQVAPLDLEFDRFGQVERFRRATWQRLYDRAKVRPAIGAVIDEGPIGQALGVQTTQRAAAMLDATRLEPLRKFVLDRIQRGGAIVVSRVDLDAVLGSMGTAMTQLAKSYTANMLLLNAAQMDIDDGPAGPTPQPEDPHSEFEKAIKKAADKQKELNELFDKVTKGVKGVSTVLSTAAKLFGEDDLATGIDEYAAALVKVIKGTKEFVDTAIEIGKAIEKLDDLTFDQIMLGAGIGFNVAMLAAVIAFSGLFGKSKPPTTVILEQLKEIRKQLVDLRDEMRVRFNRIEKRLNVMYLGLLDRLEEMDFDLGQIEGNIDELQVALYDLHAELQRLATDVHAFLEAEGRRPLIEAINGFLGFRERTGEELSLEDFREAENVFFSWGNDHDKDVLQAGPEDRNFTDDAIAAEVIRFPLATNVNYLREFPTERLGLAPLSAARLANPFDWIVAGEAYAQLHEESPARAVSTDRVEALIGIGEVLGSSLSRIADVDLFGAIAEQYTQAFNALQAAIAAFEIEFRSDPNTGLHQIDLFGGVDQVPDTHPLDASWIDLRRCGGGELGGGNDTVPLPASIKNFDYSALRPALIAHNLATAKLPGIATGLAQVTTCVSARWVFTDVTTAPGPNVRVTYRLSFSANINYGSTLLFRHDYTTAEQLQALVSKSVFNSGNFNPDSVKDPHSLLMDGPTLWARLGSFPVTRTVNESLLTSVAALVQAKLVLLQRAFYAEVSQRMVRAGDPIQSAGNVLNGVKLLWRAMVTAGLPLSVEANETLRSLLFGADAILSGSDADGQDSLLDDVQDIYAFFSVRAEEPPPSNIAPEVATLAAGRMQRLSDLLALIVTNIEESGEPEPPDVFAPTLLRLQLLLP